MAPEWSIVPSLRCSRLHALRTPDGVCTLLCTFWRSSLRHPQFPYLRNDLQDSLGVGMLVGGLEADRVLPPPPPPKATARSIAQEERQQTCGERPAAVVLLES
jgi:hypothetical protein